VARIAVVLAVAYAAALWFGRVFAERGLFGGKFAGVTYLIPVFSLIPVLAALTSGFSLVLRAAQKPRHYLISTLIVTPLSIAVCVGAVMIWGVPGAAISSVVSCALMTIVSWRLCAMWVPGK
jgi:Na+-driven multidrug efflux pump